MRVLGAQYRPKKNMGRDFLTEIKVLCCVFSVAKKKKNTKQNKQEPFLLPSLRNPPNKHRNTAAASGTNGTPLQETPNSSDQRCCPVCPPGHFCGCSTAVLPRQPLQQQYPGVLPQARRANPATTELNTRGSAGFRGSLTRL